MRAVGAVIETGARDWQVFQRGADDTATVAVSGRFGCCRLDGPTLNDLRPVDDPDAFVEIRLVRESDGTAIVPWRRCRGEADSWHGEVDGVPTGGPYRIESALRYSEPDPLAVTRGDAVHGLAVGDLFVVAGQSNAAGRAVEPVDDAPDPLVRVMRADGHWSQARHPLSDSTAITGFPHFDNHNAGHSPFLAFGKAVLRDAGVPVGIVMAARGGSPIRWWDPDGDAILYRNLLGILDRAGGCCAALLWYQGESDALEHLAAGYPPALARLVRGIRERPGLSALPVILAQLNHCQNESDPDLDRSWGAIVQAQASIGDDLSLTCVIPTNDLRLGDQIHLDAASNLILGERFARAVTTTAYREDDALYPRVVDAVLTGPTRIDLTFTVPLRVSPSGRLADDADAVVCRDDRGAIPLAHAVAEGSMLAITTARPVCGAARVSYHATMNTPAGPLLTSRSGEPAYSFFERTVRAA